MASGTILAAAHEAGSMSPRSLLKDDEIFIKRQILVDLDKDDTLTRLSASQTQTVESPSSITGFQIISPGRPTFVRDNTVLESRPTSFGIDEVPNESIVNNAFTAAAVATAIEKQASMITMIRPVPLPTEVGLLNRIIQAIEEAQATALPFAFDAANPFDITGTK